MERQNFSSKLKDRFDFFCEFLRAPYQMGSVYPSGEALSSALVAMLPAEEGLIVDLGTGTGPVTRQLLEEGYDPARIVAVEYSPRLAADFRRNYPEVALIEGDACELVKLLDQYAPSAPVCGILSSLPLRSFKEEKIARIQNQTHAVLMQRGGRMAQYTYSLWRSFPLCRYGFEPHASKLVIKNIPPAKVECYIPSPVSTVE